MKISALIFRYVSFGSECDGGYMDMTKDEEQTEYVPMQELTDTVKYADIQPSPYESPYQQDIYQDQGTIKHKKSLNHWNNPLCVCMRVCCYFHKKEVKV